ncbi:hypothetical protein QVD17_14773 [Tagetes erecta]|uniref:Uncharacterized protein n=1 Tax=Tagetes erecta TaxID=13708 RepID=A0AAD8NRZ6_TARER|nr:hypothetical protein QVD17_14773 [Tagetes erecta]
MSKNPTTLVMNIMNSMMLFLIVITSTSLVSCSFSNNEQADIFMVREDQISTTQTRMTKVVENPVQIGQFKILDGKLLTFARFMKNIQLESVIPNQCAREGETCISRRINCCDGLYCSGLVYGSCVAPKPCITEHQPCGILDPCCDGLSCTGYIQGECVFTF